MNYTAYIITAIGGALIVLGARPLINHFFRKKPERKPAFLLMIEKEDGEVSIAKTKRTSNVDKIVVASEENKHLLYVVGSKLLDEKLIVGYQVLQTSGPPVKAYEDVETAPEMVSVADAPA